MAKAPIPRKFRLEVSLGTYNFVIDGKEIYEQDLPNPNRRAWVIMLYMVLHKRPVDQQKLIADNWPDIHPGTVCSRRFSDCTMIWQRIMT